MKKKVSYKMKEVMPDSWAFYLYPLEIYISFFQNCFIGRIEKKHIESSPLFCPRMDNIPRNGVTFPGWKITFLVFILRDPLKHEIFSSLENTAFPLLFLWKAC